MTAFLINYSYLKSIHTAPTQPILNELNTVDWEAVEVYRIGNLNFRLHSIFDGMARVELEEISND